MDQTENRGYPYPVCAPPLVKDASDIGHLRDLALAVDTDVNDVFNRASDTVVRPDAARMTMSATLADTANTVFPFFNQTTVDSTATTPNPMANPANGYMILREPGWYNVGTFGMFTSAVFLGLRVRFLINGVAATSWSQQADIVASNNQIAHLTVELVSALGGDIIQVEYRIGAGSPSYTYSARLWAQQLMRI